MGSFGDPARFLVAAGTVAGCTAAGGLADGLRGGFPLADRGCGAEAAVSPAGAMGAGPVVPPKPDGKVERPYDPHVCKQGRLVGNAFMHLGRRRSIAARYAKGLDSFVAAVQARCISLWLHIS